MVAALDQRRSLSRLLLLLPVAQLPLAAAAVVWSVTAVPVAQSPLATAAAVVELPLQWPVTEQGGWQ